MAKDNLDEKKVTDENKKEQTNLVKSKVNSSTSKKNTTKKTPAKKAVSSVKKDEAKTNISSSKSAKNNTKSSKSSSSTKKVSSSNKTKSTTQKAGTSKTKVKKTKTISNVYELEYYDLPYKYNQTIVKILAQTPSKLFIYWDISDTDREEYIKNYGDNFFSNTKPILIIHNETKHYSFEIEINDFANSWYVNINDADCKYSVELGRRPYNHIPEIPDDYVFISSSNYMDAPNDHILFENINQHSVLSFKNVKTNSVTQKEFGSLTFFNKFTKIYNIYDFYKKIYKDEIDTSIITNPSSSSWF